MTDYECPDEFARLFANLAESESFGGGELITVLATDGIKPNAIPAISRALCNLVEHRLNREREGTGVLVRRGLAVSPSLINDLAFDLVKACNENKIPPPPELCKLLELQLGVRKRGRSHSRRGEQLSKLIWAPSAALRRSTTGMDTPTKRGRR